MSGISLKTGYFKSYDGTQIYYEVRGNGEPLVFAYGIGCLINHWRPQIREFSKNFQVIAFDYRAHHKSKIPKDPNQLSIDAYAQDIKELLNHLHIEQAHFVAHSFGTQVCLRAYDMFPEYFKSFVFVNGFACNPIKELFGNGISEGIFRTVKSAYGQLPETSSYLWKRVINNPISVPVSAFLGGFNAKLTALRDIEIYLRGVSSMDLDSFIKTFEAMMDYDGRPVLDRVKVPTLIIGGDSDAITPDHYQKEMHHRIKGSQLQTIPYGSHCTQLDMPDFVNLKIEQFLSQLN